MASIVKDPGGKKRITFTLDGNRKTIYLGKMPLGQARGIKHRVECLVSSLTRGYPLDPDMAEWVKKLPDEMAEKLSKVGLIAGRENVSIGPFIRQYIESRLDIKHPTVIHLEQVERNLVDCFGPEKSLREFTEGDGDKFRLYLIGRKLAENTVRRRCGRAKQFFTAAVRKGLIDRNPFISLKSNVQANPERFYFVTHEEIQKVLEACPNNEWRLIVALSRFGGLRCPSETLSLTWRDIDWEHKRIRVTSPKTERHAGGESRIIPLFPELRPYLEAAWEEAKPGAVYVVTQYRDKTQNLRSRLLDIIWAAGLKEWPKLFQNMRSTRETELAERFPMHVVCRWIGNSEPVAAKHYLQLTDEHFAQATDEKSTAQNAAQSMHARARHKTTEGESDQQVDKYAKSRKVAAGNYLRLPTDSGCKSLLANNLRKLPDEDSNLGQSG